MTLPPRLRRLAGICLGLLACSSLPAAEDATKPAAPAPLTETQRAAHVLNRLGYGPRPGEVAKVAAEGVDAWIRRQLEPAKLPDPVADREIATLAKLQLPTTRLVTAYQQEIRARAKDRKEQAASTDTGAEMKADAEMKTAAAKQSEAERKRSPEEQEARYLLAGALGELMHAKLARAVLSERQLEEVLVDFWFNHFNVDARKQLVRATVVAYEQEVIRPHVWGSFRDLLGATAKSPAMLVYLDNFRSSRAYEPGAIEQAVIRQRQQAYLGAEAAAALPKPSRGLNENYGRELLELHTLGVDGGYSQKDVQEVARAFTGWTLEQETGAFKFRPRWHDNEPKVILGRSFPANGGQDDGERVLDLLATHAATAHHLAYQLCQRFVADNPPTGLVDRVAAAFLKSGGNLRTTYTALFRDTEFFNPAHYGAKSKSPFEFAASSLRAAGAQFAEVPRPPGRIPLRVAEAGVMLGRGGERAAALPRKTVLLHLAEMGQPLYGWVPPTGFSEDSTHWVSAGALVARLNFALALAGGQVPDARIDLPRLLQGASTDDPAAVVRNLSGSLLADELSPATQRVLLAQAAPGAESGHAMADAPRMLALLLGSPEFQRR